MRVAGIIGLNAALVWQVFNSGGVYTSGTSIGTVLIGVSVLFLGLSRSDHETSLGMSRWMSTLLVLLIGWVGLQVVPLPIGLVRLVSPARAELAIEAGITGFAPLSNSLPETVQRGAYLIACILVAVAVRRAATELRRRAWVLAMPLVVVGTLQAVLGLALVSQSHGQWLARGTYFNRNHYAGLLEICIPLAVMLGVGAMRSQQKNVTRTVPLRGAVMASVLIACAAVMLAAVVMSQSRAGFIASLAGLVTIGLLELGGRFSGKRMWLAPALVLVLGVTGFILLPTDQLIGRFADIAATEEIDADSRVHIWADSRRMVGDYPLAGAGYGAFEPTFTRYQTVAPMNAINFAHNDWLQAASEIGLPGLAMVVALFGLALASALRPAGFGSSGAAVDAVKVGCVGALVAAGLHGFFDFNGYVPANLAAVAWVMGLGGVRKG